MFEISQYASTECQAETSSYPSTLWDGSSELDEGFAKLIELCELTLEDQWKQRNDLPDLVVGDKEGNGALMRLLRNPYNQLTVFQGMLEFANLLPRMPSLQHVDFRSDRRKVSHIINVDDLNMLGAALLQGMMDNISLEIYTWPSYQASPNNRQAFAHVALCYFELRGTTTSGINSTDPRWTMAIGIGTGRQMDHTQKYSSWCI